MAQHFSLCETNSPKTWNLKYHQLVYFFPSFLRSWIYFLSALFIYMSNSILLQSQHTERNYITIAIKGTYYFSNFGQLDLSLSGTMYSRFRVVTMAILSGPLCCVCPRIFSNPYLIRGTLCGFSL